MCEASSSLNGGAETRRELVLSIVRACFENIARCARTSLDPGSFLYSLLPQIPPTLKSFGCVAFDHSPGKTILGNLKGLLLLVEKLVGSSPLIPGFLNHFEPVGNSAILTQGDGGNHKMAAAGGGAIHKTAAAGGGAAHTEESQGHGGRGLI
ncbi:UNVERIFIED_CONTAM: hypothetical protein K2H54_051527 [Gekko kuhli]